MRERFLELGFILGNIFNPFGTTVISGEAGTKVYYEELSDGPPSTKPRKVSENRLIVPTGSSARIMIVKDKKARTFFVDDFRERPGHTAGVRVFGQKPSDGEFKLDSEKPEAKLPGLGKVVYLAKGKRS